ncbi:MAG: hypothetical protein LBL46_02710 [Rickettsiales bacterium]|jgi:cation:H+ antiporter|nr:hypothetical protein [Rickettsiales bacterium]
MMWLFLAFGIALMTLGADWVVGGCGRLARHLRISPFIVSALVIGVGGNIPEILITIMSAGGELESGIIPIIVSSNIINILGIVGAVALFSPIVIRSASKREVKIMLFSTVLISVMLYDGRLDFAEGLGLFAVFFYYMSGAKRSASRYEVVARADWVRTIALLAAGVGALYAGSEVFVKGVEAIMSQLSLAGSVIGSLIIAPATSGPEIIVSILALRRGRPQIMVGNMLGSCVSHIVLVAAIAGVLAEPATASFDYLWMLLATIMFSIDIAWRKRIGRWNGIIYLLLLGLYFRTFF